MVGPDDNQSPLVHGFPAWDLLPANPLLLRRRPTGTKPNRPVLAAVPPPAIAPAVVPARPATAAAPAEMAAAAPQPEAPENSTSGCTKCGASLDAGAMFCGECGSRVGGP